MLKTRDNFREEVFKRDHYSCVVCKQPAVDAHHIIERRLFENGGYFLDNGASLCEQHHIEAEQTIISCDELRKLIGINKPIIPEHFYPDYRYDKWGNIFLDNGMRSPGELFYDESVQKILKSTDILNQFIKYIKYPRTFHLPWSPGATSDDKILKSVDNFENQEVVITVKMDGENTNLYKDFIHARSLDFKGDATRSWMQNFHSKISLDIPAGWRLCGENLFATHSIKYNNLKSYFYLFSIWNEKSIKEYKKFSF